MRPQFSVLCLALVVVLLPMAGCPLGFPAVMLGEWAFFLGNDPFDPVGLVLFADGSTAIVTEGYMGEFFPTLTWAQNRKTFTLHQVSSDGAEAFIYRGTIFSTTTMEGTFEQTVGGSESGDWTAFLVPQWSEGVILAMGE